MDGKHGNIATGSSMFGFVLSLTLTLKAVQRGLHSHTPIHGRHLLG